MSNKGFVRPVLVIGCLFAFSPAQAASPNGTTLTPASSTITDSGGTAWTLTSGGQIAKNGTVDPVTGNVILLLYYNSLVYQEISVLDANGKNMWWSWGGSSWASASDPRRASVYTPITGNTSYKLTFDEEFNGTVVDRNKWQVTFDGNPDHTYSTYSNAQFWNSTNLTVGNGVADFAVTKCPTGYCTSAVTSNYLQTYGYWEARVKAPVNAHGIGVNFWSDAQGWVFPENDLFEWSGSEPATYKANWHDANANDPWVSNTVQGLGIDQQFHVIGMLWTPTAITWYYDGTQQGHTIYNVGGANAVPQWVILGATVGPWGETIDSSTVFPAHYQVDYVHIYSNASGAVAVTPQANYGGLGAD